MFVKDFANYIRAQNVVTSDVPIRASILKAQDKVGVMIMTPTTGLVRVEDIPKYYKGNVQIIVRNPDPELCYAMAESIMTVLEMTNTIIGQYNVKKMNVIDLPILYPRNDSDLYEVSINLYCAVQKRV